MDKHLTIPFFIPHEGCPFTCVFCNQWEITGEEEVSHPEDMEERVLSYLKSAKAKHSQIEVAFFGGSFTGIPYHHQVQWLSAASALKKRGLIDGIRLSTRPDYISHSILKYLLEFGVTTIELGVQSLVDDVLLKACRGHSLRDILRATRIIRGYPLDLVYQLMLGLPGDSFERAILTAKRAIKIRPDYIRIYPTLVLKGTALAYWYEDGKYKPWSLAEAVEVGYHWFASFLAHEIPTIRMGLQAAENLSLERDLLDGPYHPAYGELVESRLLLEHIKNLFSQLNDKEVNGFTLYFNPRIYSKVTGQHKKNIDYLQKHYNLDYISLSPRDTMEKNDLALSTAGETVALTRKEFLEKYRIH